jgi:hypothetical protein
LRSGTLGGQFLAASRAGAILIFDGLGAVRAETRRIGHAGTSGYLGSGAN